MGSVAEPTGGDYAQAWHDVHAGATSMVMSRPRDLNGRTSYQLLGDAVPSVDGPIIDLACGDGFLLDALRSRPDLRVGVGIDLNRAELRAAQHRLGPNAPLLRTTATALPFATSTIAVVTSHFSLMLLLPIADALAEIERVLQPAGTLIAVLPGPIRTDVPNGLPALRSAFAEIHAEYPIELPPIQDDRILEPDPRTALLDAAGLTVSSTSRIELHDRPEPALAFEHLWLTYGPELLSDTARAELHSRLRRHLAERIGTDGLVPMVHTIDIVVAASTKQDRRHQ